MVSKVASHQWWPSTLGSQCPGNMGREDLLDMCGLFGKLSFFHSSKGPFQCCTAIVVDVVVVVVVLLQIQVLPTTMPPRSSRTSIEISS